MIKLEDAFFGVMIPDFNNSPTLHPENLFDSTRVRHSVALWKTKPESITREHDPLMWCFGDTRWRCEYEWLVSSWPEGGETQKVDVYEMYVEPNRKLLLEIVDNISTHSCQKWLREYRKKYGRRI